MTAATEYKNPTSMYVHGMAVFDWADDMEAVARMEVNGMYHNVKVDLFYREGHQFFAGVTEASVYTAFEDDDGSVDHLWVQLGWQKVQDLESVLLALNHLFAPDCWYADPTVRPDDLFPYRQRREWWPLT